MADAGLELKSLGCMLCRRAVKWAAHRGSGCTDVSEPERDCGCLVSFGVSHLECSLVA